MANFKQIRVELGPSASVRSVTVSKDAKIEAIFLNGSEKKLLKDMESKRVGMAPEGFILDPPVPTGGGDDTPVCYLVNGELLCW